MATERALPEFVMVTDAKNCQVTISTNRPKDALAIAKFLERACDRKALGTDTDSVNSGLALTEGEPAATPAAAWRKAGEPDPHGARYDCERAALTLGNYTDDELANGAFLNYDVRLSVQDMLHPKPGQHMPIVWMTAVKDRIRWLSRALEKEQARDSLVATASQHEKTPVSVSSTAVSEEEAKDAARFRWYFSDKPKDDWLTTYLDGVRIGWTTDQWRAAIDVAMQASNGLVARQPTNEKSLPSSQPKDGEQL
jgi:hypothetical protein